MYIQELAHQIALDLRVQMAAKFGATTVAMISHPGAYCDIGQKGYVVFNIGNGKINRYWLAGPAKELPASLLVVAAPKTSRAKPQEKATRAHTVTSLLEERTKT